MPKRRPPKAWFNRCVTSVSKDPDVEDPYALCGWVWYHHMSPSRALKLLRDGRLRYHPQAKRAWSPKTRAILKEVKETLNLKTDEEAIEAIELLEHLARGYELKTHDPSKAWDKAMRVSGKLLVVEKAKAGLRKGRQAFTDLVEVALNLPSRIYDRVVKEGYFTEYGKGTAARRGRSKRGTNIFIMRRG